MRMKSMEIIKKILAQMFPEVDIIKNAKNYVSQTKKKLFQWTMRFYFP